MKEVSNLKRVMASYLLTGIEQTEISTGGTMMILSRTHLQQTREVIGEMNIKEDRKSLNQVRTNIHLPISIICVIKNSKKYESIIPYISFYRENKW